MLIFKSFFTEQPDTKAMKDWLLLSEITHGISFPLSSHRKGSKENQTDKSSPRWKEKAEQKKTHLFSLVELHVIPYKAKFMQHMHQKS